MNQSNVTIPYDFFQRLLEAYMRERFRGAGLDPTETEVAWGPTPQPAPTPPQHIGSSSPPPADDDEDVVILNELEFGTQRLATQVEGTWKPV